MMIFDAVYGQPYLQHLQRTLSYDALDLKFRTTSLEFGMKYGLKYVVI